MSDQDQEAWQRGVLLMEDIHGRLSPRTRQQLGELLDSYRRRKGEMLALTSGSSTLCRDCGGQCCLNGKYRFSGLDLLALLEQAPLPAPDFTQKPLCPYGNTGGCCLDPPFRPLDCVLFICSALDGALSERAVNALALLEQELRRSVQQAETLLEQPVGRPLLLLAELPGTMTR